MTTPQNMCPARRAQSAGASGPPTCSVEQPLRTVPLMINELAIASVHWSSSRRGSLPAQVRFVTTPRLLPPSCSRPFGTRAANHWWFIRPR